MSRPARKRHLNRLLPVVVSVTRTSSMRRCRGRRREVKDTKAFGRPSVRGCLSHQVNVCMEP
jgi:hypothetical protein